MTPRAKEFFEKWAALMTEYSVEMEIEMDDYSGFDTLSVLFRGWDEEGARTYEYHSIPTRYIDDDAIRQRLALHN